MRLTKFAKLARLFIIPLIIGLSCLSILSFTNSPALAADTTTPATTDDPVCDNDQISPEIKAANGCTKDSDSQELETLIQSIVNDVIAVAGTVAVIFIVVGGINYMTSTGDPNKIQRARNTIMYACIGLAICALSFAIVNFVIIYLLSNT